MLDFWKKKGETASAAEEEKKGASAEGRKKRGDRAESGGEGGWGSGTLNYASPTAVQARTEGCCCC